MNSQQAKFVLQGYRPNGADAGDATFQAALEQTERDPALREWFAREQAIDGAISAKLGEIEVPVGLREAILAGGKITESQSTRPAWWRQPAWMAVAASVALVGTIAVALWPGSVAAKGSLSDFVLADAKHAETHRGHGEEAGALQKLLSQASTRLGGQLPVDFASLSKTGCRTLNFREHEVLEVCFQRNGIWFHCYIARRMDFSSLVAAVTPRLVDDNGASMATWADASLLYVVVSEKGRASLEKLL